MKQRITDNGIIVLTASEGKVLRREDSFGYEIWLGKNSTPDEWEEVDESVYEEWLESLEKAHEEEHFQEISEEPETQDEDGAI